MVFGKYHPPFQIENELFHIEIQKSGMHCTYRRSLGEDTTEKIILMNKADILIHPIEPLLTPQELTSKLLVAFDTPLKIQPGRTVVTYMTFPIEIGVIVPGKDAPEVLDVFTLCKNKFTLHNDPRTGTICKYWKSTFHTSIPEVNPLTHGVLELTIKNTSSQWISLTKVVLNAYGMKIYFDEHMVAMKATIKVLSKTLAETEFSESPLHQGMSKSVELFAARLISVSSKKFIMDGDL